MCSQQAGALPRRKENSGEGLAQDWSASLTSLQPALILLVLLFKSSQPLENECLHKNILKNDREQNVIHAHFQWDKHAEMHVAR